MYVISYIHTYYKYDNHYTYQLQYMYAIFIYGHKELLLAIGSIHFFDFYPSQLNSRFLTPKIDSWPTNITRDFAQGPRLLCPQVVEKRCKAVFQGPSIESQVI